MYFNIYTKNAIFISHMVIPANNNMNSFLEKCEKCDEIEKFIQRCKYLKERMPNKKRHWYPMHKPIQRYQSNKYIRL